MDKVERSWELRAHALTEIMEIENLFRSTALAVGLMEIEN